MGEAWTSDMHAYEASSPGTPARAGGAHGWDEQVLADMRELEYTDAIIVTDGCGQTLHLQTRTSLRADVAEVIDIALGAMVQAGRTLAMDELQLVASIYRRGTIVAAGHERLRVVVLASGNANLGQLISQVRRVFVGRS